MAFDTKARLTAEVKPLTSNMVDMAYRRIYAAPSRRMTV